MAAWPRWWPAAACTVCLLLASAQAQPAVLLGRQLSPGSATVATGAELLQALAGGVGEIALEGDVALTQEDMDKYQPIVKAGNGTWLVRSADPGRQVLLDWGGAIGLIQLESGTLLAFEGIQSQNMGDYLAAEAVLPTVVPRAPYWPAISGDDGHMFSTSNSSLIFGLPGCTTEFVAAEIERYNLRAGPEAQAVYQGGTRAYFTLLSLPLLILNSTSQEQEGTAILAVIATTTECYDPPPTPPPPPGAIDGSTGTGGGGGTPAWVWAVAGTAIGVGVLAAAVLAASMMRRRRQRRRQMQAMAGGGGEHKDGVESQLSSSVAALTSGSGLDSSSAQLQPATPGLGHSFGGGPPAGAGGAAPKDIHSTFMLTRIGVIEGLQLGEQLGRGAYGRVYKGRWNGAIVAVKVVENVVQPGRMHDLSREPLLSMSVSHPNVVTTHKISVVRIHSSSGDSSAEQQQQHQGQEQQQEELGQQGQPHLSGSSGAGGGAGALPSSSSSGGGGGGTQPGASSGSGSGEQLSGRLVPAYGGTGGLVEVVSPHSLLQPGTYETFLVTEYCDRGSLADLIASGKLAGLAPGKLLAWVLSCLLDIAAGLEYLHNNTIIHGDLKPANVLLKSGRSDGHGLTCKLGDFGLSRMLGQDQTHVDTGNYGTAFYAAPELLSEGKLTKASDIFAFGLMIWQLMSRQPLHDGMSSMQVVILVSQKAYRPQVPPGCSPHLQALMQRCWSQDPAHRPKIGEVVEELRGMRQSC